MSIDKLNLTSSELDQIQEAIRLLENNNSISVSLKNINSEDFSTNNKVNYDKKNFNGEKVEDFRKQGEYGPKKFIKP